MAENNIENSIVTFGNGNIITVNSDTTDWETISEHFFSIYAKLPQGSPESIASKKAIEFVVKKDNCGLKDFIRKNIGSFTSNIFCGAASGLLVEFIKRIVGS